MILNKNDADSGASLSNAGLDACPSGYYPGTWADRDSHTTETIALGKRIYSLRVVGGEVVIDQLSAKEAAIDEIKAQPFYGG